MPRPLLLPIVLAFALLAACAGEADEPSSVVNEAAFQKEGTLSFLDADGSVLRTIDIEVAETQEERARGLMGRRSLGYDRGMLFLFTEADTTGFWMKSTPLPLDIVFVAPDSQVINVAERTTPFSEEIVYPEAPKQFVVEVRAGFADRFGLTDSTRITWQRL